MIVNVLNQLKIFFDEYIQPVYKVTKIEPCQSGWEATVEVIEEKEYMEAYAEDEIIGVYHVKMNENLEVESFSRISMRSRNEWIEAD